MGNQFGFRKGIASKDAIFKLTNEILNALNNKTMAGIIFCNLEKAFDSVNLVLLLSKLHYYGINGKAILLLESYLQNIKEFKSQTRILIITQSQNGPE